uniref:glycosyltransferase family 2 protein n=1 Tax=Pantoea sp. IMH TaxID=1267600 RepID=UPI0004680AFE|nr:glycosyltransferase family A protein [Pantoea sp. IMH]
MKKVSVLIACFNAEQYIEQCLRSLFVQTLDDYEIIIVDDGSTDSTVNIIHSLIQGMNNVIFIPRKNNLGTIKTRNELLNLAENRSEYIAWCDADDIYHKDKLITQYNFLKKHPDYLGCGTWYKKFDSVNKKVFKFLNAKANTLFTCFGSPVGFPTFMQKNNIGILFDETLDSGEDYAYISELAKSGSITNIKRFLTYYRVHAKQESTLNYQRQKKVHDKVSRETCNFHLKDKENLYQYITNPVISDSCCLSKFVKQINHLNYNKDDAILASIFDYRFLSYNKRNIKFVMRYFLHRNVRMLSIIGLYIR